MIMKKIIYFTGIGAGSLSMLFAILTYAFTGPLWSSNNFGTTDTKLPQFASPFALASILMVGGIIIICVFLDKLFKLLEEERKAAPRTPATVVQNNAPMYMNNPAAQPTVFCTKCGTRNPGSASVCSQCGSPLNR